MVRQTRNISAILLLMLLYSCRASRAPVQSGVSEASAESYINTYKDLAISEMKRTGIPASITLAQGIIESDLGRSPLARDANNHFGIKCHDDWTGPTARHNDNRRNECFRKYGSAGDSFRDHSDFLLSEPRYKSLFALGSTDYKAWAYGLKRAGYATDPDYANMLIRKINEYNLYNYDGYQSSASNGNGEIHGGRDIKAKSTEVNISYRDTSVKENFNVTARPERIRENNRIQYIIVSERDTKESLEKEFQLLNWELQSYNELRPDFKISPGQIIYLQPKRSKAEAGKNFHFTADGETMYQISQIYGIKMKNLYLMNRMTEGSEPVTGQKIWLRGVKPAGE
jgi:LysM repeat protein